MSLGIKKGKGLHLSLEYLYEEEATQPLALVRHSQEEH